MWLFGLTYAVGAGVIGATGQFRFSFTTPSRLSSAIGVEFTSQAIVAEPTGLLLTNPDCKEIRS